jgi:hypothetical protein
MKPLKFEYSQLLVPLKTMIVRKVELIRGPRGYEFKTGS